MHASPDPFDERDPYNADPHKRNRYKEDLYKRVVTDLTFPEALRLCAQVCTGAPAGQCHAVVIADEDNNIVERTVLEGIFTPDHAVGWAAGHHHVVGAPAVLLVSAVDHCAECINPLMVYDFERTSAMLGVLGMELRDWLIDDGYVTRSMAYTCTPQSAWLTDTPAQRTGRLQMEDPSLVDEDEEDLD